MIENFAEIVDLVRENNTRISELELSARAYNVLRLNGIKYLSDFIAMDLEDLKKLDLISTNIAEELFLCAREHLYILRKNGMAEKNDAAEANPADTPNSEVEERDYSVALPGFKERTVPPCEVQYVVSDGCEEKGSDTIDQGNEKKAELDDDRPIEVLQLSVRAYNCLKRSKIDTIRQLSKMTLEELTNVKNMGRKTVVEIESKIIELMSEKSSVDDNSGESNSCLETPDTRPIQKLGLSSYTTNNINASTECLGLV